MSTGKREKPMKAKRFAKLMGLVCAMLIVAVPAQAFYNPSTGRWLSRDPIGEKGGVNLNGISQSDVVNGFDLLGLDGRSTVRAKLFEAYLRLKISKTASSTDFHRAVLKLYGLANTQIVKYGSVGEGNGALYYPDSDTLVIGSDLVGTDTLIHEMTHSYNDVVLKIADEDRMDEGMGYAMQSFWQAALSLAANEKKIRDLGCDYRTVKGLWQNFWGSYGTIPNAVGWGTGATTGVFGKTFPIDASDLGNLKTHFGVSLSCKKVAEVFNEILQDHRCCFRVICSGATEPCGDDCAGQISPGVLLDPLFH
jgi:hypothetical protein